MAALTDRAEVSRLEVVETGRRRRWTEEEKLRIVAESLSRPRQVSSTARRHGIPRSLLTTWRRQLRVRASPDTEAVPELYRLPCRRLRLTFLRRRSGQAAQRRCQVRAGIIVIEPDGDRDDEQAGVVVDAGVDVVALERVLDLLERRG